MRHSGGLPENFIPRRCPAKNVFEQFELIEKRAGESYEVVGVKCRWCDEVILDEATAKGILAIYGPMGLTAPLLIWGGLHMLMCRAPKGN